MGLGLSVTATTSSANASGVNSSWLTLLSIEPTQIGRVMQMTELLNTKLGSVTSVKLSSSSEYVLLGYGVRDRDNTAPGRPDVHRVVKVLRWNNKRPYTSIWSAEEDVNIALFHPLAGHGLIYGTKVGRVYTTTFQRPDPLPIT